MQILFQNIYSFIILILFSIFQINFGVISLHNWRVSVTKINIFGCFTHYISYIDYGDGIIGLITLQRTTGTLRLGLLCFYLNSIILIIDIFKFNLCLY